MPKPAPAVTALLFSTLDRAFDHKSWHGPNLTSALKGVTPPRAAFQLPGRKSIWHQLLHAAYWKHRVLHKLSPAPTPFPRNGSDWPPIPTDLTVANWQSDLALLRDLHARLRQTVSTLPTLADPQLFLIQGAAAHDLYHAGQIKLLRRLLPPS